jgi:pimeloyl-ACP methyl ester carboxylesterase
MGKSLEEIPEPDRKWCKNSLASGDAKYTGTVAVVEDMLNFVELRNEEQGKPPQEAKLSFYGASYGTAIGTTFAMMFPDRIDRMILDGVVDVASHYKAQRQVDPLDPLDFSTTLRPCACAQDPSVAPSTAGTKPSKPSKPVSLLSSESWKSPTRFHHLSQVFLETGSSKASCSKWHIPPSVAFPF